MKASLVLLTALFLFACSSSKNYMAYKDPERGLKEALRRLDRSANDEAALQAIPALYQQVQETRLAQIRSLSLSTDLGRYADILGAYSSLQGLYTDIAAHEAAFRATRPANYADSIAALQEEAAGAFYAYGVLHFANARTNRDEARRAFTGFQRANEYRQGYRDARTMADAAYELAVVNVVVNPVRDNSFFVNNGWGRYGYDYTNQYFSETLLRDLQSASRRFPARFYSDVQLRRENVRPNWVVDLVLRNMYVPYPQTQSYTYNRSKQIEVGKDTSGRALYETVNATVQITRSYFTAYADFDVQVHDLDERRDVTRRSFRENFDWQEEYGTYRGDSRALDGPDWNAINNRSYGNVPRKEEIMTEIYRRLYPQVRSEIERAVDW